MYNRFFSRARTTMNVCRFKSTMQGDGRCYAHAMWHCFFHSKSACQHVESLLPQRISKIHKNDVTEDDMREMQMIFSKQHVSPSKDPSKSSFMYNLKLWMIFVFLQDTLVIFDHHNSLDINARIDDYFYGASHKYGKEASNDLFHFYRIGGVSPREVKKVIDHFGVPDDTPFIQIL
jgi:hypothetical protein